MTDEKDLRTRPDSVSNFVKQLFDLSDKMLKADLDAGWAIEARAIANCLAEGLNLDGAADLYYFADDGNYGNADRLTILDVSKWTDADWDEIDGEPDELRVSTALEIDKRLQDGEV